MGAGWVGDRKLGVARICEGNVSARYSEALLIGRRRPHVAREVFAHSLLVTSRCLYTASRSTCRAWHAVRRGKPRASFLLIVARRRRPTAHFGVSPSSSAICCLIRKVLISICAPFLLQEQKEKRTRAYLQAMVTMQDPAPNGPPTELPPVDPSNSEEKANSYRELLLAAEYLESKTSSEGLASRIEKAVASAPDALSATNALADSFIVALDMPIDDFDSLEGCMQVVLMWLKKECAMNSQLVHKISNGLCKGVKKEIAEGGKASEDPRDQLRLKCMALLYNSVSEDNVDERFSLLVSTISLATDIRMVSKIVDTVLPKIDVFMRQWDRDIPDKRLMYKVCYEALRSGSRMEQSFAFNVKQLQLYNGATEEELLSVEDATVDVIVQAVRLEKLYRFDTLLELDAVKRFSRLEGDRKLLFELINIFVRDDLAVFTDFRAKNGSLLEKYEIDIAVAEKKMRLLTFASLGIDSQDLTYGMIAKALQIPEEEVEEWVIRAISSGLVDAKINQLKSSVAIYRSTQRMFTREEWQPLSERINIWKENVSDLLTSLKETKHSSGRAAAEAFSG